MSKKRTENSGAVSRSERDVALAKIAALATSVTSVLNTAIKWGCLLGIFYFLFRGVDSLSGKKTLADIGINLQTSVKLSEAVAYILGAGGVTYGISQRRMRKIKIEELSNRNADLEKKVDTGRTSSKLLSSGNTREEDKF